MQGGIQQGQTGLPAVELRGGVVGAPMPLAYATALLDMARSGVTDECGDVLYDWWGETPVMAKPQAVAVIPAPAKPVAVPAQAERAEGPVGPMPQPPLAKVKTVLEMPGQVQGKVFEQAPVRKDKVLVSAACEIWQAGEPGGLVLALRAAPMPEAGIPLQGKALTLVLRMLQASGLADRPVGWAVLGTTQETVQPAMREGLRDAVLGLQPQAVLVLGQVAVGTLAGQALGVEGWQAGPKPLLGDDFTGAVGVTYPPELLLARPLFKRLAWQHLQKWQAGIQGIE